MGRVVSKANQMVKMERSLSFFHELQILFECLMEDSLEMFVSDNLLRGAAYENVKGYIENVYVPLSGAINVAVESQIEACCAVMCNCNTYLFDVDVVDEDVIRAEITRLQLLIIKLHAMSGIGFLHAYIIAMIAYYMSRIAKLEQLLYRLINYDMATQKIFDSVKANIRLVQDKMPLLLDSVVFDEKGYEYAGIDTSWCSDLKVEEYECLKNIKPVENTIFDNSDFKTILFAVRHPFIAYKVGPSRPGRGVLNISTNAARFTNSFPLKKQLVKGREEGSERNAMRHVLWVATIANHYGNDIAQIVSNAHENNSSLLSEIENPYDYRFSSLEEADMAIDLLNNQIGISIAGELRDEVGMKEISRNVIKKYYELGFNTVVENGDGTYSIQIHRIDKIAYERANWLIDIMDDNGFLSKD